MRRYLNSWGETIAISPAFAFWPSPPATSHPHFNISRFGPPVSVTQPFNLPMARSLFLGSYLHLTPVKTASSPPWPVNLVTEQAPHKKDPLYVLVRSHYAYAPTACTYTVSGSFHPLPGFFSLSSRYWFTIGQSGVFSLGGGPPIFRQIPRVPPTIELTVCAFVYGAVTALYRTPFQTLPLTHTLIQALGCSPSARRYWGNLG